MIHNITNYYQYVFFFVLGENIQNIKKHYIYFYMILKAFLNLVDQRRFEKGFRVFSVDISYIRSFECSADECREQLTLNEMLWCQYKITQKLVKNGMKCSLRNWVVLVSKIFIDRKSNR